MCTECTLAFFLSPVKSGIVAFSLLASVAALIMLKRLKAASTRTKLTLLYLHVFAFVFPFLFFAFFRGCQQFFRTCGQAKTLAVVLGLTGLVSLTIALALAPVIFAKRHSKKSIPVEDARLNRFVQEHAEAIGIKAPRVYALRTASPVAFSFYFFRPRIFLSVGLFDILGRKEIEAVILHELAHIRSRASLLRLSAHVARLLSPISILANFLGTNSVNDEEAAADNYAVKAQGTSRHLNSAKAKIISYLEENGR